MGGKSVLDYINMMVEANRKGTITYNDWCYIRRHGTQEELEEAVERMMAAGGYDNLV